MLIDDALPEYDFQEIHSIEVDAPGGAVYDAVFATDLGRPLLVRLLMGIRSLPTWLESRESRGAGEPMTVATLSRAGFTLLGTVPPREVLFGIEGRFWQLRPGRCASDAAAFGRPVPPGVARAVWNFTVEPVRPDRARLQTETRIRCGDERSRRRFGRYWRLVQPGSALIRRLLLRAIRDEARQSRPAR